MFYSTKKLAERVRKLGMEAAVAIQTGENTLREIKTTEPDAGVQLIEMSALQQHVQDEKKKIESAANRHGWKIRTRSLLGLIAPAIVLGVGTAGVAIPVAFVVASAVSLVAALGGDYVGQQVEKEEVKKQQHYLDRLAKLAGTIGDKIEGIKSDQLPDLAKSKWLDAVIKKFPELESQFTAAARIEATPDSIAVPSAAPQAPQFIR